MLVKYNRPLYNNKKNKGKNNMNIQDRLTDLEMFVSTQEQVIEDLNAEVIHLSKMVESLTNQVKLLRELYKEPTVKPLSEEIPPPHY